MNLKWLKKQPKGKLVSASELYELLRRVAGDISETTAAVTSGTAKLVETSVATYSTTLEGTFLITVPNVASPDSTETDAANRTIVVNSIQVFVDGIFEPNYTTALNGNDIDITLGGTVWTGGSGSPVAVNVKYRELVCLSTLTSC